MGISGKDHYFVATKLFLRQDDRLLILKDNFGDWDLPGGRLKEHEFETSLHDVLARKIREELGETIRVIVDDMPTVIMRHERVEQAPGNPTVRILGLGYEGRIGSGEVELSPRHTEMMWADIATFDPSGYFTGGWLRGVEEYLAKARARS